MKCFVFSARYDLYFTVRNIVSCYNCETDYKRNRKLHSWSRGIEPPPGLSCHEGRKEMFHLTTHSTHFIYGYMASDIWLRTILIVRKETRCSHVGYSFRLTARVLLYAPSHIQKTAFVTPVVEHCLEREIAQWVHPMKDRSDDPSHTMSERSYHGATSRSFMPRLHESGPFQGSHGQPRETTQHLLDPI